MDNKKRIVLYIVTLFIGVLIILLQAFIFEAPDGIIGFILFLIAIYLIIGSIIKLCKVSSFFKDTFISSLIDLLFFLP